MYLSYKLYKIKFPMTWETKKNLFQENVVFAIPTQPLICILPKFFLKVCLRSFVDSVWIQGRNVQKVVANFFLNIHIWWICRRESLKTSESIDSLKFLGNLWIHWFLNFPYDITTNIFSKIWLGTALEAHNKITELGGCPQSF